MSYFLGIVVILILLGFGLMNRTTRRRCEEDIDEVRSSLYELRKNLRSRHAETNRLFAELRVLMLKSHQKIPADRNPYYITSDCIACGTCLPECPVNAIHEGEIYIIDCQTCIACKKCAEVCPVNACVPLNVSFNE